MLIYMNHWMNMSEGRDRSKYLLLIWLKVAFFQKVRWNFFRSPNLRKKIFQKTILSLKFEIPAHISKQLRLGDLKNEYHFVKKGTFSDTLGTEMFGVGDFWLKTRIIITILSHPWYPRTFDRFSSICHLRRIPTPGALILNRL